MSENDGEGALGVLSRQCVGICVADTGVQNLDADFVRLGGCNLNILNRERLASAPCNGSLASDGLNVQSAATSYESVVKFW